MLDPQGKTIAGAYYIYIRQLRPDGSTPLNPESNKTIDSD
jgi:hypothetical protein